MFISFQAQDTSDQAHQSENWVRYLLGPLLAVSYELSTPYYLRTACENCGISTGKREGQDFTLRMYFSSNLEVFNVPQVQVNGKELQE